ncbi:MAG: DUF5672 family protein [Bacteroidia bacterium]
MFSSDKMKELAVILIIAHKPELSEFEKASLAQCYAVLDKYAIRLIVPEGMDVSEYKKVNPKAAFEFIDPKWQSTYAMFNRLKIEPFLYRKFSNYKFILFYELDAWVFHDELEEWCGKDFDYIGAPWFKGFHRAGPDAAFTGIGNGGFSLRKVETYLKSSNRFSYIVKPEVLFREFKKAPSVGKFFRLLADLTFRNNTFFLFNDFKGNEDFFWMRIVAPGFPGFKIPSKEEALKFAIETNPSAWIKTEKDLPFGCHAFLKYEPDFWADYIPVLKNKSEKA